MGWPARAGQPWFGWVTRLRQTSEDDRRREFILLVLLMGALALSVVAVLASIIHLVLYPNDPYTNSLAAPVAVVALILGLWRLLRLGYYRVSAWVLVAVFFASGSYLVAQWSFELPQAELFYALVIVMAGVIVGTRAGVAAAVLVSLIVGVVSVLQSLHYLHPDTSWLRYPLDADDMVIYLVIFGLMALVSWLSNREIDRSLVRARRSEAALKHERDNLEVTVRRRTRQLEQAQLERVLELQRLAALGQLSAGLLHDLANPLTAASLNLQQLSQQEQSQLARQAMKSMRYLERYVETARKQLQNRSPAKNFSATTELKQVIDILTHKARSEGVVVELKRGSGCRLFGDAVKFNQMAANLIANAIDAYSGLPATQQAQRTVRVSALRRGREVVLTVSDHGCGIPAANLPKVFRRFYSTKQAAGRGIGLGLAMVQQTVETDFGGSIAVTSTPAEGTRFVVRLRDGGKN